jgi:hypothetical protein
MNPENQSSRAHRVKRYRKQQKTVSLNDRWHLSWPGHYKISAGLQWK